MTDGRIDPSPNPSSDETLRLQEEVDRLTQLDTGLCPFHLGNGELGDCNCPDPPEHIKQARNSQVDHPPHYNAGDIECIDALVAAGLAEDFCRGNAIKYLWRMNDKGDPIGDAQKAQWYINKLVELLVSE